jgi:hypothetical protein
MTKILISPGHGAGWSTWADDSVREFMLKDPTLIAMAERKAPLQEVDDYIESQCPDDNIYTGGWRDIEVVELPAGTLFIVDECDGYESIGTRDGTDWVMA